MSITAHANAVPAPAPSGVGGVIGNIGKNIGKIIRKGGGIGTAIQVGVAVVDIVMNEENTSAQFVCESGTTPYYQFANGIFEFGKPLLKASSFSDYASKAQGGKFDVRNMRKHGDIVDYYGKKAQNFKYDYTKNGQTYPISGLVVLSCLKPHQEPKQQTDDVIGGSDVGSRPTSAPDVVGGSEVGAGAGAVPDVGKGTDVGTGVGVGADARPIPDSQADSIPDSKAGAVPDVGAGVGVGTGVGVGAGTQAGTQAGAKADSKADTDTALPPETAPTSRDEEWELEFPVFCDWAKPVCDFLDWFKKRT